MEDINKFIKLMNLTTPPVDAEALNALRKANKILENNKTDWNTIITQKIIINNIVPPVHTTKPTYTSTKREDSILDEILRPLARAAGRIMGKAFK